MRRYLAAAVLLLGCGCNCFHRRAVCTDGAACAPTPGPGPVPTAALGPVLTETVTTPPTPAAPTAPAAPATPRVEIKAPEVIHVKVPPPRIIVEAPPPETVQQQAPFLAQQAAPQMMPPTAPAVMAAPPQYVAYPQQVPPMTVVAGGIQSAPSARAIPAIGLDWVRIPFPIPRLFAVPTQPEYQLQVAQAPVYAQPVNYYPAPAVQQFPAYAAPMPVPMQAPAMMPQAVQYMQAPQQQVPVYSPAASCAPRPVTQKDFDELNRQVKDLEEYLKKRGQ